ncbi:hypothetical protein [Streptomyces sp. NPDC057694]|uniref:hypothetical protein n=1 Tax=Streptomyces sp. NPDC057694 TaxID=3346216 RepID=UPI0036D0089F
MAGAQTTTELVTHYSSQFSTDLERNTQEQDKIRAEIEELKGRLQTLQHDHSVLATMRNALESGIPLQQNPSPDADDSYDYGLPVGASGVARRKQYKTTLVALIRAYLAEQAEPCSAAEVATALSEAHPDRVIKTTVVRTTLEGLVARSSAQRLKQGHSVFYAGLDPDGADSDEGGGGESAEG